MYSSFLKIGKFYWKNWPFLLNSLPIFYICDKECKIRDSSLIAMLSLDVLVNINCFSLQNSICDDNSRALVFLTMNMNKFENITSL